MSLNSKSKVKTFIHFFYILFIGLSLVYATANAAGDGPRNAQDSCRDIINDPNPKISGAFKDLDDCIQKTSRESGKKICETLPDKINEGIKAGQDACSSFSATSSSKNCQTKLKSCGKADSMADSYAMFANVMQMPQKELLNCFDSPKTWKSEKKELESDLKSLNRDIRDAEEKVSTVEKNYQKTVKELQKALVDEQEKYNKFKEEAEQNSMDEEEKALTQDQQNTTEMDKILEDSAQIRTEIGNAAREAEAKLIAADGKLSASKCRQQTLAYKKEVYPPNKKSKSSTSGLLGDSHEMNQDLDAHYDACLAIADKARAAVGVELQNKLDRMNRQLDRNETRMNQLRERQAKSAEMRQKRMDILQDKQSEKLKQAMEASQRLQLQAADEQKSYTKEKATAEKFVATLNQSKNIKTAALTSLGKIGSQDTNSDKSIKDLVLTAKNTDGLIQQYLESCNCGESSSGHSDSKSPGKLCDRFREAAKQSWTVPSKGGNN